VVLLRTRLEIADRKLRDKLRLYALLAPHMKGLGQHNTGWWHDLGSRPIFHVEREGIHLAFGAYPDFKRRSVGYVGQSDGWQDLMDNFKMDWEFERAEDGNIALTGEVDLSKGLEFVLAVAFGRSAQSAATKLCQSLAIPFEQHREGYVKQWKRTIADGKYDFSDRTGDGGSLHRLSRLILLAHEDKVYPGALVASMSIPWGEIKGDTDLGGYHLVWTRDLVKSASALLAAGQVSTPLRSLLWLACVQAPDGSLPQNSWINGDAYWRGKQLDEVAAPILLAWRLRKLNGLGLFDPWQLISHATRYLLLNGPVTGQERWEENSGYSPSTLAWIIAGLVCAADFARDSADAATADFILDYADWLSAHLEQWTVTRRGELAPGKPVHYVRITPADPEKPNEAADPDTATIQVANGGGLHPARNVVSGDFLELVRLGLRSATDPLVVDSVAVIDAVLKRDLPQGPGWRRYNHDGYGQKEDGGPFDGTGIGRCWPLLTGERGHYELAAGRDPLPFIKALEGFANEGGMLPEQVWDDAELPDARMFSGKPIGSAMPLCWAHAEYLTLVRSSKDGAGFDLLPPVYDRYVRKKTANRVEIWTLAHQPPSIRKGKTLRIITAGPVTVRWSIAGASALVEGRSTRLDCWFVDLPTEKLGAGARLVFSLRTPEEGTEREYSVAVERET
jgi:glucoamylase